MTEESIVILQIYHVPNKFLSKKRGKKFDEESDDVLTVSRIWMLVLQFF